MNQIGETMYVYTASKKGAARMRSFIPSPFSALTMAHTRVYHRHAGRETRCLRGTVTTLSPAGHGKFHTEQLCLPQRQPGPCLPRQWGPPGRMSLPRTQTAPPPTVEAVPAGSVSHALKFPS